MNERKLNKLFNAARNEPPPATPHDLDIRVTRQIHGEPSPPAVSFVEQLNALFPKLAFAALMMIALCVAGDFFFTALGATDVDEGVARISDQWLLGESGI